MRIRADWRAACGLTGTVLKWLAMPLALPLVLAVYYGEPPVPFLVAIGTTLVLGEGLERLSGDHELGPREAFLMVALIWLLVAVVGALPMVLAGRGSIAHPINAMFESMSAVTTTGATVLVDFDTHSRSILLWRGLLQWLGGFGILVVATAVLSRLSVAGAQLMETETQTRTVHRLTPHISETARLLWLLYVGLTGLAIATLYGLGLAGLAPSMTLYDAVAHALTSVSTAGFSPRADSIAGFSPAVQWALVFFMAAGATSFVLIYHVLQGDFRRLGVSEEFRFYIGILGLLSAIVATLLVFDPGFGASVEGTARHAVFQVVSIVTTTGYASVDFDTWSPAAKHVLFIGMFVGGMAGSTTCSIKTVRWLVVLKGFRRDLFVAVHPEAVRPVRLGKSVVPEEAVRDIYAYTLITLLLFLLATVFVVADAARVGLPVGEFEAMSAAAATFLNIGPAFGLAGPFGSYETFPASTKLVMTFLMWIGRIEIIPVLVLLTPSYWRS